jgi:hypothetical protein
MCRSLSNLKDKKNKLKSRTEKLEEAKSNSKTSRALYRPRYGLKGGLYVAGTLPTS